MSSIDAKRGDVPGLTGLRFVAAMFVVLSHSLHSVTGFSGLTGFTESLSQTSALGMTLFFVLSGFVIHYNYQDSLTHGGLTGYWSFFVARFARLYPLYFVLLIFNIYYVGLFEKIINGDLVATNKFLLAGPLYLTLTQSWFFGIINQNNLIYQFDRVGAISWSISTEWFFYLTYPLICMVIAFLKPIWVKGIAIVVLSAVALSSVWLVIQSMPAIDAYALSRFGPPASMTPTTQDSLVRWLLYFSPYSRVTEFILGVLICAIYIDLQGRPVAGAERRLGIIATTLGIAGMGLTHFMLLSPDRPYQILTSFHMVYGYALPVALTIFCIARYPSFLRRFLEWRPIVAIGEVSYSLYFLHFLVIGWFQSKGFLNATSGRLVDVWLAALSVCIVSVAASFVTYNVIEVPARRWFRRILSVKHKPPPVSCIQSFFVSTSQGVVLFCLVLLPFATILLRPPPKLIPPPEGTVDITQATYGGSCGAAKGNITPALIDACSGTKSCIYVVDVYRLGDPASGCSKDFSVDWRCSKDGDPQHASIPAEAGLGGKSVSLSCPTSLTEAK